MGRMFGVLFFIINSLSEVFFVKPTVSVDGSVAVPVTDKGDKLYGSSRRMAVTSPTSDNRDVNSIVSGRNRILIRSVRGCNIV